MAATATGDRLFGETEGYDKTATTSELEALRLEVRRLKENLGNVKGLKNDVDNLRSRVAKEESFLMEVGRMNGEVGRLASALEKRKEEERVLKEEVMEELKLFKQVEEDRRMAHENQAKALRELVDALAAPTDADSGTDLDNIRSALNKMEKSTDGMRRDQVKLERSMQELKYKVDGTGPVPEGGRIKNFAKKAVGLHGIVDTDEDGQPRTLNDPYKEKVYRSMLETSRTEDLSEVQGTGCLFTTAQERSGTPLLFIIGSKLPRTAADLHKVFLWGISEMDEYTNGPWSLVYVHGKSATIPGKWINSIRSMLDPKYERNLHNFFVVQPSMALRLLFGSMRAGSKANKGKNLIIKGIEQKTMKSVMELFPHVRLDTLSECIPHEIYAEDSKHVSASKKVIVMVEEIAEIYSSIAQIIETRDQLLDWAKSEARGHTSVSFGQLAQPFQDHGSELQQKGPCIAVYAYKLIRLLMLKQSLIDQDIAFQSVANHHQQLSHSPEQQVQTAKHLLEMMSKAGHNSNVTSPMLVEALMHGTAEELMSRLGDWSPAMVDDDGQGGGQRSSGEHHGGHHAEEQYEQQHDVQEDAYQASHAKDKKKKK